MKFMDKLEYLKHTYKKEDSKIAARMLAVLMILKEGEELNHTAKTLRHCTDWVHKGVDRFEEHGLDVTYTF